MNLFNRLRHTPWVAVADRFPEPEDGESAGTAEDGDEVRLVRPGPRARPETPQGT